MQASSIVLEVLYIKIQAPRCQLVALLGNLRQISKFIFCTHRVSVDRLPFKSSSIMACIFIRAVLDISGRFNSHLDWQLGHFSVFWHRCLNLTSQPRLAVLWVASKQDLCLNYSYIPMRRWQKNFESRHGHLTWTHSSSWAHSCSEEESLSPRYF